MYIESLCFISYNKLFVTNFSLIAHYDQYRGNVLRSWFDFGRPRNEVISFWWIEQEFNLEVDKRMYIGCDGGYKRIILLKTFIST